MGEVTTGAVRLDLDAPPDLSTPGDLLDADARAGIHALLGRIPGVTIGEVSARRQSASMVQVTLDIDGWSPTLHAVKGVLVANAVLPKGRSAVARVQMLRHPALRRLAAIQSARAAAGLAMGLSAAMPPTGAIVPMGSGTVSRRMPTEMRHLLVDATLPAILAAAGEDPEADLADGIRRMHNGLRSLIHDADDGLHADGDIWIQEIRTETIPGMTEDAPGTLRVVGRAAVVEVPDGMTGSYDGRRLRLTGHGLPDTVLAAMPGRRLDTVVRLHPALDHRIVEAIETFADTAAISFTPHLTTVARAIASLAMEDG